MNDCRKVGTQYPGMPKHKVCLERLHRHGRQRKPPEHG